MNFRLFSVVALLSALLSGCSSTSFYSKETLQVDSTPVGADVWIDGELRGKTPLQVKLESIDLHEVELRKEGFRTERVTVYSDLSENAKTGIRVNPLVLRGYYSSFSPNPIRMEMVSTLIPTDPNASKTWEEFSSKLNQLDQMLANGVVSKTNHRLILKQLIEFYE